MQTPNRGLIQRGLDKACEIHPEELRATLASFSLVLILMAAYYILRPVRDAMASDWSDAEVSLLWTLTFFFSLVAVSLYGVAVSRIRLRHLVPAVYAFFAGSFALFWLGIQLVEVRDPLNRAFYVWISVFSLFHISVFWSFMADTWRKPQATRLFGFIGAGASIGAMLGPGLTTLLAGGVGTDTLLLIGATLLLTTLPLIYWLQVLTSRDLRYHPAVTSPDSAPSEVPPRTGTPPGNGTPLGGNPLGGTPLGGNPLAGFGEFLRSPYLLGIALFIFLYTAISSFIYFELKNLLEPWDMAARTRIWAMMDLAVNTLTVLIAAFATGRIATRLGLPFTLACVPVVIAAGLLLLAATPLVAVVVAVQIVRRAGNYAISRPAREMLFTAVDTETRYRAKPVIDIVVYRGGDMLNAWLFTGLTQGLGLGLAAVALVGAAIGALWAATGIWLGRRFQHSAAVTGTEKLNS